MSEPIVLAFDIGGTDLKAGRVTRRGDVRGFRRSPSRAREGLDALVDAVREMAEALGGPAGPAIAGVGCPGAIEPRTGTLLGLTPHLALTAGTPLAGRLAGALGMRVVADNDAHCHALAESALGAAKGARVSMTVTVGTGVGCGIVIDDRLFRGAHGSAGEIGHLPLGSAGPVCRCGVPGCLEPWAGGSGLVARAQEAGLDAADARAVMTSLDPRAHGVRQRFVEALAQQIAAAAGVVDPEVIVIGGGVAQAGEALLGPLRRAFDAQVTDVVRTHARIVPAALGEQAGVAGAGLMAWAALAAPRSEVSPRS